MNSLFIHTSLTFVWSRFFYPKINFFPPTHSPLTTAVVSSRHDGPFLRHLSLQGQKPKISITFVMVCNPKCRTLMLPGDGTSIHWQQQQQQSHLSLLCFLRLTQYMTLRYLIKIIQSIIQLAKQIVMQDRSGYRKTCHQSLLHIIMSLRV